MQHESWLIGLVIGVVFAYSIDYVFSLFDDPREPRRVASTIPVIGHFLGLLVYGWDYYSVISRHTDAEIYTIGILNFKVYVTYETRLTHLTQRTKTLSFDPLLQLASKVHGDISDEAGAAYGGELLEKLNLRTREALTPGPHLDEQNLRMGEQSLIEVCELLSGQREVDLFKWAKRAIVQATAAGLYGVQHPFKDPAVADAMWTWIEYRPSHMMGLDPLRKGYKARDKVFEAFRSYCRNIPEDASYIIRERHRLLLEGGFSEEDAYKMQSTLSDAAYPNTVPTLFWTVYEIYSRPDLLEAVREEIFAKAVTKSGDGSSILDIAALQTECHILLSAYQETQRTRHSQVAFRGVVEDTLLDGKYLLKKGQYLHMPAKPIHKNPRFWGDQASSFDAHRFVSSTTGDKTKISPSSFRAWGVPPHMCPARQFASTEILIITALLALRADLAPASGKGWERDPAVKSMEISTLPRPKHDIRLKITERKEGLGSWALIVGKGKIRVSLASG